MLEKMRGAVGLKVVAGMLLIFLLIFFIIAMSGCDGNTARSISLTQPLCGAFCPESATHKITR